MAISVLFNGVVYSIPETGEESWGENLTTYFVAIPQGALQKTGGNFTLTADVNFGPNFGLLSRYFSARSGASTTGLLRLASIDTIGWRNNADTDNIVLSKDTSDRLCWNTNAFIDNSGNIGVRVTPDAAHPLFVKTSLSGTYLAQVENTNNNIGTSFGLQIIAGTNGSDAALTILNTAAATLLQVLGNGNVGVGTAAPGRVFDVAKSVSNQYVAKIENTNTSSGTSFGLQIIGGTNGSDAALNVANTASTTLLQILGNGNVGIGTASPSRTLDVSKSVSNQYVAKIENTNTSSGTSFGFQIIAGTNGSDAALSISNTSSNTLFQILGNGQTGVLGGSISSSDIFSITGTSPLSGTIQRGIDVVFTANSAATGTLAGVRVSLTTANSTTHAVSYGYNSAGWTLGSGGVITNAVDFFANGARAHTGTNNAAFADNNSFTGNWFLNQSGSDASLLTGTLRLASLTASQAVVTDSSKNLASLAYATTNSASSLVQRDGSGNFSAGTITANLNGNASTVTTNANLTGDVTSVGNATTAAATQANITTLSNASGVAVHGTNTNNDASSGYVGEYVEVLQTTYTNITTSNTYQDLGSISLTAGDWELSGHLYTTLNGATMTGGVDMFIGGTVSGNNTTGRLTYSNQCTGAPPTSTYNKSMSISGVRLKLSSTTTVYMKVTATFSAGNPQYQGRFSARRLR